MPATDHVQRLSGVRIVFVLPGELVGGAERNAIELAARLAEREGAAVQIWALDDRPGRGRDLAAAAGLPWRSLRVGWAGSWARKAAGIVRAAVALRRLRPEILISTTNLPNIVCGFVAPVVRPGAWIWVQCDVLGTARISTARFGALLRRATAVVTMAFHARDWLVAELGADPRKVHVIYSEVSLRAPVEARDAWRTRIGLEPGDLAVSMLGHLHRGKDHDTLVRAWRHVVDDLAPDGRRAVLLLGGRFAGTHNGIEALADELGLGDGVRLLGDVDDVSGLLAASDLAVFSSRSECLGRGATEPMAAGLAVAGTDIPGIREAVGPGRASYLAPPGDARALADAIFSLARDAELRRRIGAENAELIRKRQSAAQTTDRWVALLVDALAGTLEAAPA